MKLSILLSILAGLFLVVMALDKVSAQSETVLGTTYYDLQTWRTMQNRIYVFDDGTKGSVWNMGMDHPGFPDLGVGYNYYDGSMWGSYPSQSITSVWSINPSYTAYLENGEMIASQGENGLIFSIRENKGTGNWQENLLAGSGFKHPVVVTNGPNHNIIQLLYLKADESFTPTAAQPYRGFIWYARSTDAGQSWDIHQQVSELGSDHYLGFTIGSYCWAKPEEDVIAFVAGDYLTDLVLMKSIDGGDNWQKTIIWEHPYPFLEIFTMDTDTFYCNNGGISVALDNEEKANVAFTLSRVYSTTDQDTIWYEPEADGVVYWNEDRPTFSNDINALCPYTNCSYTELEWDYSLIGWMQDINGNDTLDLEGIKTYPTPGLSIMPQIVIDDMGRIFVVFCAVSETYDNGFYNYRHIWVRHSPNGEWWGQFIDLNDGLIYIFSECVYPSIAPNVDDSFYLTFQEDAQPGISFPFNPVYNENNIRFMSVELGWNPPWVNANFISDTTIVREGDTVNFTNYSTGSSPNYITYEWWFEAGFPESSTETDPVVVYNTHGTFDVKLKASIDMYTTDELFFEDYITVLPAIDIDENIHSEMIEIFPNPGSGLFTIDLNQKDFDEVTMNVYNILGEHILESSNGITDDQLKLDLTDQENGIYFIQIKNGSTLITKKIAVQH